MRRLLTLLAPWCLCAALVHVAAGAPAIEGPKPGKPAKKPDLFAGTTVWRIQLEIPRAGMAALRDTAWGNGQVRPVVRATVKEGGRVYTNVAVHLKGAAGSFRPIDHNPAFTLNFEKFAPGQSFHGVHKLSLNNSVQDRSLLSEQICRELFEAAGVPVPRAGHAKVELNGRDLGLYVLVEGFNKQFLKHYFKNTSGNLYDGGFVQDINSPLAVNSGDHPEDHSRLRALISAAREPDSAKRLARLEQVLDVDRFLSYLAMDVMECNWDGYAMNRNNWRLYHDMDSDRMVFMPHGLDQMFGVQRTTPECPIFPYMEGMVARAVVGTSEGRRRYLERMGQLYTNVFNVPALLRRVDELAATIRPVIAESSPQAARSHDQQVQWLKSRISERGESLKRQLAAVATPVPFDSTGAVRLSGWKPRSQSGSPVFREQRGGEGVTELYVGAAAHETVASWRTRALLDEGTYRFEGRIRTRNLRPRPGETGVGAGLRVSGGAIPQELSGNNEWRNFAYPFQVQEGAMEVEFVCEVRGCVGDAWFDASSLRVVRRR